MDRRVFYASGPSDVVLGLGTAVGGGLAVAAMVGVVFYVAHSGIYLLLKFLVPALGLLFAGASRMLYREHVLLEPLDQTFTVRRSWFLVPLSRRTHSFEDVRDVRWERASSGFELVLETEEGRVVLTRDRSEDLQTLAELRALLLDGSEA